MNENRKAQEPNLDQNTNNITESDAPCPTSTGGMCTNTPILGSSVKIRSDITITVPEQWRWMIEAHNRRVKAILAGSDGRRHRPLSDSDALHDSRAAETERLVRDLRKAELDQERAESCQLEARNDGGVQ